MKHMADMSRGARWAVPAGAVVVVGGVMAGSLISVAQAAPQLPSKTPAQLLAAVAGQTTAPPLTGTVVETASLGLPSLPDTGNPTSLSSLLTGSHTVQVSYQDPQHYRVAVPQNMSESDLIRNGNNAWLWESSKNTVTHLAIPAKAVKGPKAPKAEPKSSAPPMTPQQAASQVLARVGPTTTIRVDSNISVANHAAYQLVLVPKSSSSLIGEVKIAVDGQNNVPLQVQVFAKGAGSPAVQVGYTSVSFVKPAAANFAFSPPAGATVEQQTFGSGTKPSGPNDLASGASVIGKGWLAVADLPSSVLASATAGTPSSSPSGSSGSSGSALGGDTGAVVNALLKSGTRVSGPWGGGRLLRTSLVSMLITDNGRVFAGAVTPGVLYQAATQAAQGHPGTPATPATGAK
jgi:outer membrane lipoprotein-sorting protein